MRILFTPLAVQTHFFLMAPLASACRAAGHDIRVAAQPRVLDAITSAGLPAVAVGESRDVLAEALEFIRKNPELLHPDRPSSNGGATSPPAGAPRPTGNPFVRSAEVIAPDLVAFGEWWRPDLVVTDPMFYAGPLLAEVLGVPLVRHLWGPDWTKSGFGMGGVRRGETVSWPEELVRLYASYGVRSAADFAACTIDPFPPSLQVPGLVNRVTMRQVPYNGPGVVPGWLARPPARPRVCVTWGTSTTEFMGASAFRVPQVLAGLADLDVEVVIAIGKADLALLDAGAVSARVRVVENLPLDLLLPSCAGIVSQGGAGGMVTAAVHGVPQVIIPQMADQPANARLLAATGAGLALDAASLDAGQVKAAVSAIVVGKGPRAAAQRLQTEIRTLPAPAEIVGTLENLVKRRALQTTTLQATT